MIVHKFAAAVASALLVGASAIGLAGPALAVTCATYPDCPGQAPGVSANIVVPGQPLQAQSGDHEFDPGSHVGVHVRSVDIFIGTVIADSQGNAKVTFIVPQIPPGLHHVVFIGPLNGVTHSVAVPFTVVLPAGAAGSTHLPRTGASNIIPMTEGGLALVVAGAGVLVAVRRRRPGGLAA